MLTINKFESKYRPFSTLSGDIENLFSKIRIEPHCKNSPEGTDKEFWLNIEGLFNGKSIYVKPCKELYDLLTTYNIYGEPTYGDIYIKLDSRNRLCLQYRQIIGSYTLIQLNEDQASYLKELLN